MEREDGQFDALVMRIRDEERRKIVREIHDGVGQTLVALSMNLQRLQDSLSPSSAQANLLADSRTLLQDITKQVRTISYLLHPPLLDEAGLPSGLREFAEGFTRRAGIATTVHITPEFGRLAAEAEIALFRIAQECLTNIHRHSGSSSASIRLSRSVRSVMLEVRDRGRRLPEEAAHLSANLAAGVGLRGMRERIAHLGGFLKIRSSSSGTRVIATIPSFAGTTDTAADATAA